MQVHKFYMIKLLCYFCCSSKSGIMVKWKDSWPEPEDSNGVRLNLWLRKDDIIDNVSYADTKSNIILQVHRHSLSTPKRKKHKDISDIRFSTSQVQEKQNHQHPQK